MAKLSQIKLGTTTYDIGAKWENISGKPSSFSPSSHTHSYLPLSGGTLTGTVNSSGNMNLYGSNAYFSLGTSSSSNKCYFQTYNATTPGVDDANLKAGFGFGWSNSLVIDKSGNVTIPGDLTVSGGDIVGNAATATKLTTDAGGTTTPVYFSGGVPKACTIIKSGAWHGGLTYIGGDGVMEVGKYIDFHVDKTGTSDYDVRIAASTTGLSIGGTTSGTFKGNLDGNANTATVSTRSQYLETWYNAKDKTYGTSYPLYAWWETGSECRLMVDNYTVKVNYADSAGTCTSLSTNAGSTTKAIYFTGGKPAQCNDTINHNITGSATSISSKFSADTSKYNQAITWYKADGTTQHSYIGAHNTGNSTGAIIINPVKDASKDNWSSDQGLYIGKTVLKFWGTNVSLSTHTHSYLPLSGGTMTGQLHTAFKSSVAMGSYQAAATTVPDLAEEVRYSSGAMGSVSIGTAYAATGGTIAAGWYNFIYSPHRSGGNAGAASGDNHQYGTLILSGMTGNLGLWVIRVTSGSIAEARRVWRAGDSVTGAVWNDYAEYRESQDNEPGYVLIENGDDTLSKSTERLQQFAGISSDTWGFSQGETEKAKTPIAVAGRVLAHTYQNRNNYKPGDAVCTAPGGTVDIMTEEEIMRYPHRIVGTVSCIPDYEEWGGGNDREPIKVNGRIWIKIK